MGLALGPKRVDRQRSVAGMTGVGMVGTGHQFCAGTIGGTDPGILFLVRRECVLGVDLSARFVVGLGTVIIAGELVMQAIGVVIVSVGTSTLCSTRCSTLCSGGDVRGNLCISPGGKSYSWTGLVRVWLASNGCVAASLCLTDVSTRDCFSGNISWIVVTNSSITSYKCSFHIKNVTWQCCENSSAEPEILYAHVLGTKKWLHW